MILLVLSNTLQSGGAQTGHGYSVRNNF